MAIKTTIGPKGVVSEKIAGTDDVYVLDVEKPRNSVRTIVSGTGTVTITGGANMFVAPVEPVTAALPTIGSEEVGTQILLLNDDNATTVQVSGTNNVNGDATVDLSGAYGVLGLVAVKSDDDGAFHWHVLDDTNNPL